MRTTFDRAKSRGRIVNGLMSVASTTKRSALAGIGAAVIALVLILSCGAWQLWPARRGLHLLVRITNATSKASPAMQVVGPGATVEVAPLPPRSVRDVRLDDAAYGEVVLLLPGEGTHLGLLDSESDATGASGTLAVTWQGPHVYPTSPEPAYGLVNGQFLRFRPTHGPIAFGSGVWPLDAR